MLAGAAAGKRCFVEDFACNDGLSCIPFSKRCDNVTQCGDGSDEHHCDFFNGTSVGLFSTRLRLLL